MSYIKSNSECLTVFDYEDLKDVGSELAEQYAAADPFPHIVIDDFLDPRLIDQILEFFPRRADADSQYFERDQERFKRSYQPDYLPPQLRGLFYAFNARPFIRVIENITGIRGLVPDPFFMGGGFHEISNGGHLSVHADFNHHKPMDLERRVNVLIYLNKDWKEAYGGQLELWRPDMSEQVQSIVPIVNRCAIFTTTQESMHGNPTPVAHPDGISRKSIALYYYTSTWDPLKTGKTTQFRPRPGTDDKTDWDVKTTEFLTEYLPPALSRLALRAKYRLARRK